ncbi:methyltransferase domain-containing protein [Flavitalea sp. BT771]|uniref:methyltransferase domain-containing protein n=1 Tax=Flavitalea sp. BT771 TaxID=3063329 RepID=UPI0026E35299|nr:methyltransferase domain-containing protein [Flavitalea sp. BT771]MDO6432334.1 methyltransferase domain-containing protein [Flavitalea sp. BT771]MDV6221244.1 methyltransferase domain-containing protein [Flavitalea sp. BT771]
MSNAFYWDQQYLKGEPPWDMHQVSPPLQTYFDHLQDNTLNVLIPGCGNGYEAGYLLDRGFTSITLIDISEVLMERLKDRFGRRLTLIIGDFFDLSGEYDLIVEQTFFCALTPSLRQNYIEKMYSLLRPGGKLAGLLFDRDFPDGPPFGGSREEYQRLLEKRFKVLTLAPCLNSIKPRMGTELFFIAEKPI